MQSNQLIIAASIKYSNFSFIVYSGMGSSRGYLNSSRAELEEIPIKFKLVYDYFPVIWRARVRGEGFSLRMVLCTNNIVLSDDSVFSFNS